MYTPNPSTDYVFKKAPSTKNLEFFSSKIMEIKQNWGPWIAEAVTYCSKEVF